MFLISPAVDEGFEEARVRSGHFWGTEHVGDLCVFRCFKGFFSASIILLLRIACGYLSKSYVVIEPSICNLALLEEANWEQWRLVDARKCERSVCSWSQIWRTAKVPIWGNYQILVAQFRCNHHRVVACNKREIMKRNWSSLKFLDFWRTLFNPHSTSPIDFFHKCLKSILLDPNRYILATKRRRHKSSFIGSRFQSKK